MVTNERNGTNTFQRQMLHITSIYMCPVIHIKMNQLSQDNQKCLVISNAIVNNPSSVSRADKLLASLTC